MTNAHQQSIKNFIANILFICSSNLKEQPPNTSPIVAIVMMTESRFTGGLLTAGET